ncbi:MAG: hypothetical protein R3F59_39170, partial [Myxococcota bacterium]
EDEVTIKVAPQLAERAREVVPAALRDKVVAAPELDLGCLVETQTVSIDATLGAAVDALGAATTAWLAART